MLRGLVFPPETHFNCAMQLLFYSRYLHAKNIIHRDMKSNSILFSFSAFARIMRLFSIFFFFFSVLAPFSCTVISQDAYCRRVFITFFLPRTQTLLNALRTFLQIIVFWPSKVGASDRHKVNFTLFKVKFFLKLDWYEAVVRAFFCFFFV